MKTRSGKLKERIYLLVIVSLAFLLFGCGAAPEGVIAKPASAEAIAAGNVENGRDLFMGNHHFENNGPPCMGCHNVGDTGLLGGGSMGPDLTNVSNRLTQEEMASLLANSGTEISHVMQPIYTTHPLTETEQADLIVFLTASVGQPETDKEWLVVAISLAGFVAAVAFFGFVYRNRLRGVRKGLVRDALKNQ
jgi:mono/diheme cytochrome c family protein